MEIRQDGYVWNAPHILHCSCGSTTFEVQFRFSESIRLYQEMGGTGHKPDMMVVVCAGCEQEITITETEAKMPSRPNPSTSYNPNTGTSFNPMAEQVRRATHTFEEYVRTQTQPPQHSGPRRPDWEDIERIKKDLYGFKEERERRVRATSVSDSYGSLINRKLRITFNPETGEQTVRFDDEEME